MEYLGAPKDILDTYKDISSTDLSVNKDVTEENRFGQGTDSLPWFWRMEGVGGDSTNAWMDEFYRIHWLEARTRYHRWSEELTLVRHEMYWVRKWFEGQEEEWKRRASQSQEAGHRAYAERKGVLYHSYAEDVAMRFQGKMSQPAS
ncbi:hypothetical protein PAXRUDRAFT_155207 [Paxillus rubicundulus Ve08.2h10]|uniref:Uncharacterized protein n=1 Tax=Paxillus rubicundulus Ve08.2h10 TaxID=930991 RepID=A0A0D0CGG0_9AGAM|nr:hypothetical protein PAXRUDRAFT_155207 [Paxillus rubicundulus Ve08.2h10]